MKDFSPFSRLSGASASIKGKKRGREEIRISRLDLLCGPQKEEEQSARKKKKKRRRRLHNSGKNLGARKKKREEEEERAWGSTSSPRPSWQERRKGGKSHLLPTSCSAPPLRQDRLGVTQVYAKKGVRSERGQPRQDLKPDFFAS